MQKDDPGRKYSEGFKEGAAIMRENCLRNMVYALLAMYPPADIINAVKEISKAPKRVKWQ